MCSSDLDAPTAVEKDRPVALAVDFNRTVGDLRRLIALARDAGRLRAALIGVADFTLGIDGTYCYCDEDDDGHSDDCTAARAALEGTYR